ncbi:hypothetical protein ACFL4N_05135 [Thermodesulfobacteriota bacterium]
MHLQKNQDSNTSKRNAGLGILLTWFLYLMFALLTDWNDYGLGEQAEGYSRWIFVRLSTMTVWLFVAALLLRYRKHPVNWRSFSYSFVATGIIAMAISSSLVSASASYAAIAGAIVFYALVSGFLCVTIRKPAMATVLGLLTFAVQFFGDATAHIFSGAFRVHF